MTIEKNCQLRQVYVYIPYTCALMVTVLVEEDVMRLVFTQFFYDIHVYLLYK